MANHSAVACLGRKLSRLYRRLARALGVRTIHTPGVCGWCDERVHGLQSTPSGSAEPELYLYDLTDVQPHG